jgi:hypothetical protein
MECVEHYYLKDTPAVVQHLERRHTAPIRCPICAEEFVSRSDWNVHIVQRACVEAPAIDVGGVTEDQFTLLRDRKGRPEWRSLSERDRWYVIYDILFPNTPRPASPYVGPTVAELYAVSPVMMN